jgi:hypothetical protein
MLASKASTVLGEVQNASYRTLPKTQLQLLILEAFGQDDLNRAKLLHVGALRKLRHPSRSKALIIFTGD